MALKSTGLTIPINVQHLNEVIVYPAGITLGTTAISDNGVSLKTYLNEEIGRLKDRVRASLSLAEV